MSYTGLCDAIVAVRTWQRRDAANIAKLASLYDSAFQASPWGAVLKMQNAAKPCPPHHCARWRVRHAWRNLAITYFGLCVGQQITTQLLSSLAVAQRQQRRSQQMLSQGNLLPHAT